MKNENSTDSTVNKLAKAGNKNDEQVSLLCDKEHSHEYNGFGFCYLCGQHKIQHLEHNLDKRTQLDVINWSFLNLKRLESELTELIKEKGFLYSSRNKKPFHYVSIWKNSFSMEKYNEYTLSLVININLTIPRTRKGKAVMLPFRKIMETIRKAVDISNLELKYINFHSENRFTVEIGSFIDLPLDIGQLIFENKDEVEE